MYVANYKQLPLRPWAITQHYLARLCNAKVIHFDLFAYIDTLDPNRTPYFRAIATHCGKAALATSHYYISSGALYECEAIPNAGLMPLYWTRASHEAFRLAHPYMLAQCVIPDGYTKRSVLAHYVTRTDSLLIPGIASPVLKRDWYSRGRVAYKNRLPDLL
jgi:hypothetical protein